VGSLLCGDLEEELVRCITSALEKLQAKKKVSWAEYSARQRHHLDSRHSRFESVQRAREKVGYDLVSGSEMSALDFVRHSK